MQNLCALICLKRGQNVKLLSFDEILSAAEVNLSAGSEITRDNNHPQADLASKGLVNCKNAKPLCIDMPAKK